MLSYILVLIVYLPIYEVINYLCTSSFHNEMKSLYFCFKNFLFVS